MIRLFVALELPQPVRMRLAMLGGGVPGAKWQGEDQIHLTLRFIGEVDEHVAHDIDDALASVRSPAFKLELIGVGTFGGRDPHALWAGVRPNEALFHLHRKIETALQRIGLPPESRKFAPHVSLAKLKRPPRDKLAEFIQQHALFASGAIPIGQFVLYSSQLGSGGSVYRIERTYELLPSP